MFLKFFPVCFREDNKKMKGFQIMIYLSQNAEYPSDYHIRFQDNYFKMHYIPRRRYSDIKAFYKECFCWPKKQVKF